MELSEIIPHIEALIFASEKPLTPLEIVELINNAFGFMEERITLDQVESAMEGIREKYDSEFYPFEVKESGGGWQFLTKKDFHKTIAQLNGEKFLKRLSTAALETLAIIAYKQPITKGEIEAIRGVNSDYSVQKLLEKELIVISGRNEKLPGHPLVYATSKTFMDYFGINSAEDLPKIKEVFADQLVEPTLVRHQESETSEFLQGDSSEEFAEPHMEQGTPEANDAQDPEEQSQLTINEDGMLVTHAETTEVEETGEVHYESEEVDLDEVTGEEEEEEEDEEEDDDDDDVDVDDAGDEDEEKKQ